MKARIHEKLADPELLNLTALAARKEKEATLLFLEYLLEVDLRKLYATQAYSSLFEYLVKALGLSEPAAAGRVNAVRLMRQVPEVKNHLEEGRLTLTSASQIQRFIKTEEKVRPRAESMPGSEKSALVESCLNQSKREVEKTLFTKQSDVAKTIAQEKVRLISSERSEIKFCISEQTVQKLAHLKNLIGDVSLERIFELGLDDFISKEEKKRGAQKSADATHSTQPAEFKKESTKTAHENSRYIPIHLKRAIFNRSKGQCEYVDSKTGRRCASRYRVQVDHVYPFALGGDWDESTQFCGWVKQFGFPFVSTESATDQVTVHLEKMLDFIGRVGIE